MRLSRDAWHDITRDTDWTPSYVTEAEIFPDIFSGCGNVPREKWHGWREDYRISYEEYVSVQREKEEAAYSVKAALQRSSVFDSLDEGWKSSAKAHHGATTLIEYLAVPVELKMARFGLTGGWRNMAVLGALDEMRHTQLNLFFAHEFLAKDPQYDWAQRAYHTNEWAAIAGRALFDGFMASPSAVDVAVQLPFTFETGFTNLQFVALASDALGSGDINFANMISSIQTDEARHAQQGGPTLELLMEHDPERAQWLIDKTFWQSARIFAILTGPSMDYYTPLGSREQSYKEFMTEWIVEQFVASLNDYGLKKPWYWDEFMASLDTAHHALHLGVWFYRPTVWWNPNGGMSKDERAWLNDKYPNFEKQFGPIWDQIIANINSGNPGATLPQTLPWLCNLCQLPIGSATAPNCAAYPVQSYKLVHDGYPYYFCSDPCRRIWFRERERLIGQQTVVERMLGGQIQPPDVPGLLAWMGITPDIAGKDAHGLRWADDYLPATVTDPVLVTA
jgi:toluene monooxygenase system protein A